MLILLLLVLWIMFYIFISGGIRQTDDWRLKLIAAAALSGGCLILLTEVLSLLRLLKQSVLIYSWLGVIIMLGVGIVLRRKSYVIKGIVHKTRKFNLVEILLLSAILILVIATGIISYVAAPNNWDSMLYHLTRVAYWQQNHTVAFFPTHNLKQLAFNPFSEYVLLHLHILSKTDQFDNLLQWWAMVLSMIGISYITHKIGASRSYQLFSALFVVTLPMSIFQSSTTQNDYVLSAWVVGLVCYGFAYLEKQDRDNALLLGILLALAIYTKATGYIYCLPVLIWLAITARKKVTLKQIKHVLLVIFLVVCLNLPFWIRNNDLFGNPLGPSELSKLHVNDRISLFGTILNLFRNLGSNFIFPDQWSSKLTDGLAAALSALKIDLNDPRFTFQGYHFSFPGLYISEDTSGNPLHLVIILLSLAFLVANKKRKGSYDWKSYVATWISMLLLFSGYLRLQFYGNRLLLPWFILAAPIACLGIYYSSRYIPWLISALMVLCTVPVFYFNPTKPLWQDWNIFNLPRMEVMIRRKDLLLDYTTVTEYIIKQNCHSIGLIGSGEEWEYPIWSLFRNQWGDSFKIENVLVENVSNQIEILDFNPCALLVIRQGEAEEIINNGVTYTLVLDRNTADVYLP